MDESRKQFEEWYASSWRLRDDELRRELAVGDNGDYIYSCAYNSWRAWTASRAVIEIGLLADKRRMDWLVSKAVNVRDPMVYGSHSMFWSQAITDEEDDYYETKLREQIDAAMDAEAIRAAGIKVKE